MAVTGIVLFGFVIMHMLGNLKAFTGTDIDGVPHVDIYAHFLRTMGEPMMPRGFALWIMRIILLAALVLHVVTVIELAVLNRAARPVRYKRFVHLESTFAARSMLVSGVLLLVFVVVHILQFTTGTIQIRPIVPEQVYSNLFHNFGVWYVTLFYVIAMAMLGFHLYHGAWSLFQSLGQDNPDRNRGLRLFAALAAVLLLLGFCAVPVLFFLGAMPDPPTSRRTDPQVVELTRDQRCDREAKRNRPCDVAKIERRRMDLHPVVLQQRIEVGAFSGNER